MSPQTLRLCDIDPVYLISPLTTTELSAYEDDHTPAMSQPQRTASTDSSADAIRKRVCKACDRCRLKKSKCDGSNPCSRCKADNAICVFGERKKSHDKVYPKGYVEMLEQQQEQLVLGLQEMYRRMRKGEPWSGPTLSETNGHPLTHDILAALGLLETKHDGSGELETFEENVEKLQSRLIADGAGYVHRRGSFSSDSEHSQHSLQQPHRSTTHSTPSLAKPSIFDKNFSFASASPSPVSPQSPLPRQRRSYPPVQQHQQPHSQPSPLPRTSQPLINSDPQLFQPEWAAFSSENASILRSNFALRAPQLDHSLDQINDIFTSGQWDDSPAGPYDLTMGGMSAAYSQPFAGGGMVAPYQGGVPDYGSMATMDLDSDFKQFIQVTT